MDTQLFHIFRNTPLGRETLLQSLYFSKIMNISLQVYIPKFTKFLMYFENDVVQIDLDESYLTSPETAADHAAELIEAAGKKPKFLEPKSFTASTLPDIPTNFDFMCCPRSISDLSSKIGLGYIGPRVRRIVKSASFPVLITSSVFKQWNSTTVFFGGSNNAVKSLKLGFRIARLSNLPLYLITQSEGKKKEEIYAIIKERNLEADFNQYVSGWSFFESGKLEDNLYNVPHDSLAVIGAFGHGLIKDILFGSKMEIIQGILPNNILIVGPNYTVRI